MRVRNLCVSVVMSLSFSLGVISVANAAAPLTAKQEKIKKLMDMTSSGDIGMQIMSQMISRLRATTEGGSDAFWNEFQKQVDPRELIALIVPIYDKHFSTEEIDAMIKFFDGPVGKKFVSEMPKVMEESMTAGEAWGAAIAKKAQAALQKQKK